MITESCGSFKDSMWLVIRKKREHLNFFFRVKIVLDLNFETEVFVELLNNSNRIRTFDFLLET